MKKEVAKIINNYCYGDCEIYEDYSGRGMYGRTTTGIKSDSSITSLLADVMEKADEDEREMVADAMRSMRSDNLGLGMIYY